MAQHFVREQGTDSIPAYRRRVRQLALIYVGIVLACATTIVLILWRGQFFVSLTQRSNVETLTLAFIIVLFAYLTIVSLPGFWGALRIAWHNAPTLFGRDPLTAEQRKQAALKPSSGVANSVYLNCRVCLAGQPNQTIAIPLRDAAGSLGTIIFDGARMAHEDALNGGSNSTFAYFEQRILDLVRRRDPEAIVQIVHWTTIDDESAHEYASLVRFSQNLEQHLRAGPLWPTVELTEDDMQTLRREAVQICPILRNEAFLPDLEFEAEHQLPIIPEPLGFIALSRKEKRADPVASMGCALIVAVVILGLIVLFMLFPPWVPPR